MRVPFAYDVNGVGFTKGDTCLTKDGVKVECTSIRVFNNDDPMQGSEACFRFPSGKHEDIAPKSVALRLF